MVDVIPPPCGSAGKRGDARRGRAAAVSARVDVGGTTISRGGPSGLYPHCTHQYIIYSCRSIHSCEIYNDDICINGIKCTTQTHPADVTHKRGSKQTAMSRRFNVIHTLIVQRCEETWAFECFFFPPPRCVK